MHQISAGAEVFDGRHGAIITCFKTDDCCSSNYDASQGKGHVQGAPWVGGQLEV